MGRAGQGLGWGGARPSSSPPPTAPTQPRVRGSGRRPSGGHVRNTKVEAVSGCRGPLGGLISRGSDSDRRHPCPRARGPPLPQGRSTGAPDRTEAAGGGGRGRADSGSRESRRRPTVVGGRGLDAGAGAGGDRRSRSGLGGRGAQVEGPALYPHRRDLTPRPLVPGGSPPRR